MIYINIEKHGVLRTLHEFNNSKDARVKLEEYHMQVVRGNPAYTSNVCSKEWRESAKSVDI